MWVCLFVKNSDLYVADGPDEGTEKNALIVICRPKRTSCIEKKNVLRLATFSRSLAILIHSALFHYILMGLFAPGKHFQHGTKQ